MLIESRNLSVYEAISLRAPTPTWEFSLFDV